MSNFDIKDFGERLRNFRVQKGLTQEALAMSIGKNQSTIRRFESGEMIPNAEEIYNICRELEIYEADLFSNDTMNKPNNNDDFNNPFGTNKLYVYFNAYNFRTRKFAPDKYILEFEQKQNICKVKFIDSHDGRIYSEGYLKTNKEIVFCVMENYKPTNARMDTSVFLINICNGTNDLMLGGYFGTNQNCEPSLRKCYFSKKSIDFTNDMVEKLKLNEHERETLENQHALYLDIFNN